MRMQEGRGARATFDRWRREDERFAHTLRRLPQGTVTVSAGIKATLSLPGKVLPAHPIWAIFWLNHFNHKVTSDPGNTLQAGNIMWALWTELLPSTFSLIMCLRCVRHWRQQQGPGHRQITFLDSQEDTINHELHFSEIEKWIQNREKEHLTVAQREKNQCFPLICRSGCSKKCQGNTEGYSKFPTNSGIRYRKQYFKKKKKQLW